LTYKTQIDDFTSSFGERFSYIPTVTREKKDGCLNLRIPAGLKNKDFQKIAKLDITKKSQVMICGNPDMINDTVKLLEKDGLERNRRSKPGNITLEKYW